MASVGFLTLAFLVIAYEPVLHEPVRRGLLGLPIAVMTRRPLVGNVDWSIGWQALIATFLMLVIGAICLPVVGGLAWFARRRTQPSLAFEVPRFFPVEAAREVENHGPAIPPETATLPVAISRPVPVEASADAAKLDGSNLADKDARAISRPVPSKPVRRWGNVVYRNVEVMSSTPYAIWCRLQENPYDEWYWIPRSVLKGEELNVICDTGRLIIPACVADRKGMPKPVSANVERP